MRMLQPGPAAGQEAGQTHSSTVGGGWMSPLVIEGNMRNSQNSELIGGKCKASLM